MTIKAHFLKQKELRDWSSAMVHHGNFQSFMVYVRAQLMEMQLNGDELKGASKFESVMASLPVEEIEGGVYPNPGLHHDLEPRKPADKPKEKVT